MIQRTVRIVGHHTISGEDETFYADVESGAFGPADFDHRAHLRLAYVLLTAHEDDESLRVFRDVLQRFIAKHGIDPAKYHETLTRAWLMAVRHVMDRAGRTVSFADFIRRDTSLLDPLVMMSHYSSARLFSAEARADFLPPDLDPIPASRRS